MDMTYQPCIIKSFKHDGHLHRMWLQNWLVPPSRLDAAHVSESMIVLINQQTPIQESDRKVWVSKVPAVSFFIPGQWFNVVALIEDAGIRYYCNVASPPYLYEGVLTYIDYDLDVIRTWDGSMHVVDREEYEAHKLLYHYPGIVQDKVSEGLSRLIGRVRGQKAPFQDELVYRYFDEWKNREEEG
ncbi:DUF402 domain-containing protein [Paenibacillus sp. SYP-B4298]|uniref:DUF402 domain-containing protein n=1 Tax=Paenibacillus sp. SYP-B4298 TaxID=2996034 RepID=UPI0022DE3C26|nr:DUF402 domain-containing protein [Paenibacillus sp. SYP-B4298]